MSQFSKENGKISLKLRSDEAHILINLVEQLLELLGEGDFYHHYSNDDPFAQLMSMPHEISQPEDPVLRRLLPNAYADPEAADDFRRYTEPTIRKVKQDALRNVRELLGSLVDSESENHQGDTSSDVADQGNFFTVENVDEDTWLKILNDLRLALSVRLNIDADGYEKFEAMADENPQKGIYAVYFWLGSLQENLLEEISRYA